MFYCSELSSIWVVMPRYAGDMQDILSEAVHGRQSMFDTDEIYARFTAQLCSGLLAAESKVRSILA